jgi:hypothetical protein
MKITDQPTPREEKEFNQEIESCINGNISDFEKWILKMNKRKLLKFIKYIQDMNNVSEETSNDIIRRLYNAYFPR